MSRGLRPGILSFANGFERSAGTAEEQQQQQQQLRREKLRVQGFEQAPEEESGGGLAAVYETGGMWSDMFNYPTGGAAAVAAEELMETNEIPPNYGRAAVEYWYGGLGPLGDPKHSSNRDTSGIADAAAAAAAAAAAVAHHHHHQSHQSHQISSINAAESTAAAAAMQLFLMNPQPRSSPSPPPPPPHHHHQSTTTTTTTTPLHFLLSNDNNNNNNNNNSSNPNPNSLQPYHHHNPINPPPSHHFSFGEDSLINNSATKIGGPVESQLSQGLSLTLSSSLAKVEEFRMGDDDPMFMYYGQRGGGGGGGAAAAAAAAAAAEPSSYLLKNFGSHHYQQQQQQQPSLHLQGVGLSDHAGNLIRSSSTTLGMMNLLRNSRYVRAARELLEEFCSVGRGELKNKWTSGNNIRNNNNSSNLITPISNNHNGGGRGSSSSSKDAPPLSAADRIDYQRKKTKLLSMLDEVDRRYNHYCEQMQAVVNSFDSVMGFGAATPYTSLAQKAMSRHFRCLKDAIIAQMKLTCEALGEKDSSGATGITKGETPRLRALEQSLRQQRAFHQMGMMEQEAWRPQRGLPERSVNILRAWLFEHFLHPYPSDADKHLLSRQTGLSRNQVSNWFINARVRLWKPMVEEMYQKEAKELEDEDDDDEEDETMSMKDNRSDGQSNHSIIRTQTPAHAPTTAVTATSAAAAAAAPPPPNTTTTTTATGTTTSTSSSIAGKRTELIVNASESDPSSSLLHAINSSTITTTTTTTTQCYPENQAAAVGHDVVVSPVTLEPSNHHHHHHHHHHQMAGLDDDTWRHAADFMRTNGASTLVNFRTATSGDISLTLGLRHAGNLQPEKNRFSVVRDFGDC